MRSLNSIAPRSYTLTFLHAVCLAILARFSTGCMISLGLGHKTRVGDVVRNSSDVHVNSDGTIAVKVDFVRYLIKGYLYALNTPRTEDRVERELYLVGTKESVDSLIAYYIEHYGNPEDQERLVKIDSVSLWDDQVPYFTTTTWSSVGFTRVRIPSHRTAARPWEGAGLGLASLLGIRGEIERSGAMDDDSTAIPRWKMTSSLPSPLRVGLSQTPDSQDDMSIRRYAKGEGIPYVYNGREIQLQFDIGFARPIRRLWWYYPLIVPAFALDVVTFPIQLFIAPRFIILGWMKRSV